MHGSTITDEEIQECLERSGYLMESRIVRMLNDAEYFVEPNQAIRDPRTGKSREIDVVAERHGYDPEKPKTAVWTNFVLETINNTYPFVLLTPRSYTPNANFETYVRYFCTPRQDNDFIDKLDVYEAAGADWSNLYSQYCALIPKKSGDASKKRELMAAHPEDVYSSLLKFVEYVEHDYLGWDPGGKDDDYWRLIFWRPMLVLGGRLLTVQLDGRSAFRMQEVKMARLEFNWHLESEPRSTIVDVISENHLLARMDELCALDDKLRETIFEIGLGIGRDPRIAKTK